MVDDKKVHIKPKANIAPRKHNNVHVKIKATQYHTSHTPVNSNNWDSFYPAMFDILALIYAVIGLSSYLFGKMNTPMSVHYASFQNLSIIYSPQTSGGIMVLLILLLTIARLSFNYRNYIIDSAIMILISLNIGYISIFKVSNTNVFTAILFSIAIMHYTLASFKLDISIKNARMWLFGLAPSLILGLLGKFMLHFTFTQVILIVLTTVIMLLFVTFIMPIMINNTPQTINLKSVLIYVFMLPYKIAQTLVTKITNRIYS